MKDRQELEELISAYALGALEGEELKEVEEIIASGSPDALKLLREYEDVASFLPYASKAIMPEAELKKRVFSEIIGSRDIPTPEPSPPFWSRFWNIGLSLGGAVAVGLILLLFISNNSLDQKLDNKSKQIAELETTVNDQENLISSLKAQIAQNESEMGALKDSYANLDELSEFLEDPDVYVIQLSNMHDNKDAGSGVLVDKEDDEALLYCLDLAAAPEGKTYQWWVKADGVTKSIAVFQVDNEGSHVFKLRAVSDMGNIQEYSVTLEPEGGAAKPAGEMIFAGDHRGSSL